MKPTPMRLTVRACACCLALVLAGCSATGSSPIPTSEPAAAPQPSPTAEPLHSDCTVPAIGGRAAFDTFRTERGECIPASSLLEYRCVPKAPPVVLLRPAGRRRALQFAGGRFATPVDSLPLGAEVAGMSLGGTVVYTDPRDASELYVRAGRTLKRWLLVPRRWARRLRPMPTPSVGPSGSPTPPAVPVPSFGPTPTPDGARPPVYFLGDSVLLAAERPIEQAFAGWNGAFDAEVGRTTSGALFIVQSESDLIRGAAVIHLGENDLGDAAFVDEVRQIMRLLKGVDVVVWVNLHESTSEYTQINAELRRAVSGFSNGVIADWNAVAPADGIVSDGIHLNDIGAQAMANLISGEMGQWFAVAYGRGPDSCRAAVQRALAA